MILGVQTVLRTHTTDLLCVPRNEPPARAMLMHHTACLRVCPAAPARNRRGLFHSVSRIPYQAGRFVVSHYAWRDSNPQPMAL